MAKRIPSMAEEAEMIESELGFYVPPYQLNEMMKVASKIMTLMVNFKPQCTYNECKIILKMVEQALAITSE